MFYLHTCLTRMESSDSCHERCNEARCFSEGNGPRPENDPVTGFENGHDVWRIPERDRDHRRREKNQFWVSCNLFPVQEVITIQVPYRLVSRSYIHRDIVVKINGVEIGADNPPVYIAGPCSIESYEQLHRIGKKVKLSEPRCSVAARTNRAPRSTLFRVWDSLA